MDAGKLFVLVLSLLAIGVLVYLELKSRRSRGGSQASLAETDHDAKTPEKY